jgi:hypothetical protein
LSAATYQGESQNKDQQAGQHKLHKISHQPALSFLSLDRRKVPI